MSSPPPPEAPRRPRPRPRRSEPSSPPRPIPSSALRAAAGDPVVRRTRWEPLVPGGAVIYSPRATLSGDRLLFRRHWITPVLALVVGSVPAGLAVLLAWPIGPLTWRTAVFSALTLGVGLGGLAWLLRYATSAPWFDKRAGVFVVPRAPLLRPVQVPVRKIHAVQLLRELCEDGEGNRFQSYELNLILRNGDRFHVVDHRRLDAMLELARKTARFLGVPLWDASDVDAPTPDPDWFTRSMRVVGRVLAL